MSEQNQGLKIVVVYIYPFNGANGRDNFGKRFVDTYGKFPSGEEHELIVVSNGEAPNDQTQTLFSALSNVSFFQHDNSGYDIGGFQHVAREVQCDLMVFFSNTAYLRREGWLKRMVEAFQTHGDILYGSMSVPDNLGAGIWPHIRTTGFWMNPILLLRYPILIHTPEQRYPFEHGPDNLTMWCAKNAGAVVATFNNIYGMDKWREVVDGYHWGEQKELLTGDRMSCPPWHPYS